MQENQEKRPENNGSEGVGSPHTVDSHVSVLQNDLKVYELWPVISIEQLDSVTNSVNIASAIY